MQEKISLFDIDEQILRLISLDESDLVDQETGEVLIDVYEELEKLNVKRDEKIINIARYIDNLKRESDLIKDKVAVLTARAKSKEKQADRLKTYVLDSMQKMGTTKIEDATVSVRLNTSKAVKPIDEKLVPEQYLRTTVKVELDKKKILADLKQGIVIAGVELGENYSIVIK